MNIAPDNSPTSYSASCAPGLVQIGVQLGQLQATQVSMEQHMARHTRALDLALQLLQRFCTPSPPPTPPITPSMTSPTGTSTTGPVSTPASLTSGTVAKLARRLSMEALKWGLGKLGLWALQYMLPGAVALWGLTKAVFRGAGLGW